MILKLLIIPAAEISYIAGLTANDEFTDSSVSPRVIAAGPLEGDGACSLNVLTEPANLPYLSYLLSKEQVDVDTDVAWPSSEDA